MKNLRDYFKQLDYTLLIISVLLGLLGLLMIASATNSSEGNRDILVQSLAMGMGIVAMFIMAAIDYEDYADLAKYIYIGSLLVLIFVLLFGTGKSETGANSWIRIGGIGIQPSELVKIENKLPLEGFGTGKAVIELTINMSGSMDSTYEMIYA